MDLSGKKLLGKREFHFYSLAWLLILLGWLVVINYLSNEFFARFDLTSGKAYTLSQSTKTILKGLKQPVIITAYFSEDLPPALKSELTQIKDLLDEYKIYGRGKVKFNIVDPDKMPDLQDELRTRAIEPIQFQVRGASELSLRQGYLALEINYLDQRQVFPNVLDMQDFEYAISSSLLKISSEKTLSVAFLGGHNEPDAYKQLKTLHEAIERQYQFSIVDQGQNKAIPEDVTVLLVVGPQKIPPEDLYEIDQFIMRGGKVIFLVDGAEVAEEYLMGFPKDDGLDDLLLTYGVKRNHDLVMDVLNEKVAYRQGSFQLVQQYPLWVKVNVPMLRKLNLAPESQITNSLDSITLPWGSSLELVKDLHGVKATELLKSSPKSWVQSGQFSLDPSKLPPPVPMAGMGEQTRLLGVLLTGTFKSQFAGEAPPKTQPGNTAEGKKDEKPKAEKLDSSKETSIMVVGNSRFIHDEYLNLGDSNLDFVLNAIDYMTWGGKLLGVRSRVSTDRPFAQDISQTKVILARLLGPFVLPVMVIIYGLVRFQVRRRSKKAWAVAQKESAR